ncbi:hypothetical protein ABZT23_27945 [Streptomyces sp. NPDC005386]|uniref:hypothetical protein n=1 Tax=Streptomyces sp. NPDC005386 TaxID=3154562 RepID=UPI0033A67300
MENAAKVQVGRVVFDLDLYEARVTSIVEGVATLDYSEFPSDVPPEATEYDVADLEQVQREAAEDGLFPDDDER